MTDQEILEAVGDLPHKGELVIADVWSGRDLRKSDRFGGFVQSIRDARDAVKPLGDSKATTFLDEMDKLAQRMMPGEAAYTFDERMTAQLHFYTAFCALVNYLRARMFSAHRDEAHWVKGYELFGATSGDDIDTVIERITRHLATLCPETKTAPTREMTNEEILEAQKLIADMSSDLAVIADTAARINKWWPRRADLEKLISLIDEKVPRRFDSFYQLSRYRPPVFSSVSDCDSVNNGLAVIRAGAEMAKRRRPAGYGAKLIDNVAKFAPRVDAILDKTAQALRQIASK